MGQRDRKQGFSTAPLSLISRRAGSGSPDGDKAGYRAYLRDEVQISQLRFQAKQRKQGCLAGSGSVLEGRLHPCGGCRSEGVL
jgi:hypothetical protein